MARFKGKAVIEFEINVNKKESAERFYQDYVFRKTDFVKINVLLEPEFEEVDPVGADSTQG